MNRLLARPAFSESRISPRVLALLLLSIVAQGCGNGTEPRRAVALAIATQPPSVAQSGVVLGQAPVIELRNQDGELFAQAGVAVGVSIADGGGTISGVTTQMTNAEGRATFFDLVVSGTIGPRTLRFSSDGLSAATSSSIALAAGLAATVQAASNTSPQATVNTAVATPPSVVVKDASGNGVPGVAVTFTIAGGAGTLTGATQSTDAAGVATVGSWTLPKAAGQYTLNAAATGVQGNGVTFTGTANPDAPAAMQASGGGQSALYGARLPTALQVRVADQFDNATPNVVVTWVSVTGSGTVEPINVATDANGIVRSNYRLGTTPGENIIRAAISSRGLSADFSATALAFTNQIAVGGFHSCALDETGRAYCWGQNDAGQLGDGTTANKSTPTPAAGALRFRRITVGVGVTCALTNDNEPYCWGSNSSAALGDGTQTNRSAPTPVSGGLHFTEIATSGQLTCGVTAAGAVYCWGENGVGQLGVGTAQVETCVSNLGNPDFPCSRVPLPVVGGLTFAALTTGAGHACGLTAQGELYCWGFGSNFWGNGTGGGSQPTPVPAAVGFTFSEVTAGALHTCGIVSPSAAYCWGNATQFGVIGTGATDMTQTTPALLPSIAAVHMDAGGLLSCAVVTDGRAFCWGFNEAGGIGDGTTTFRTTPTAVSTGQSFTSIAAAGRHACGRIANGQVYCWGENLWGELGVGGGSNLLTPALARP